MYICMCTYIYIYIYIYTYNYGKARDVSGSSRLPRASELLLAKTAMSR